MKRVKLLGTALISAALIFAPIFSSCDLFTNSKTPALSSLSSIDFAKRLTIGWNLGNTLDAHDKTAGKTNKGLSTETSWGMPSTTQAMIQAVASKGFKTIRIPVSWHNHITDADYTVAVHVLNFAPCKIVVVYV